MSHKGCIKYGTRWQSISSTLVLIGTNGIGRCKSNWHCHMTMTTSQLIRIFMTIFVNVSGVDVMEFDWLFQCTVKPVYKWHWWEPENVVCMNSCHLCIYRTEVLIYMHYSLSDEYETAVCRQWFVIYRYYLKQVRSYFLPLLNYLVVLFYFSVCNTPYTLYFGVKFYPADPCKVREEITRYVLYKIKLPFLENKIFF